jgi:SagB-type dehydrogenase family enzyme
VSERAESGWLRYAKASDWNRDHAPLEADGSVARHSRWSPKSYSRFGRFDPDLTRLSCGSHGGASVRASRRSVREFASDSSASIGLDELRILLRSVCAHDGRYSYPSAGAIYATELYLYSSGVEVLDDGVLWHVYKSTGELEWLWPAPNLLAEAFPTQTWTWDAALTVVLSADMRPYVERYGERGYRFALLEVGALTHQLTAGASAAGLGSCIAGGYVDDVLADALDVRVEAGEQILACVSVGHEAEGHGQARN